MSDSEGGRPVNYGYQVPDELRVGLYANAANIWYSPFEFTLDWAVAERPEIDDPDDSSSPASVLAIVFSRIRIPVGLVYDLLQGLNQAMTDYERDYGEIRRPGEG